MPTKSVMMTAAQIGKPFVSSKAIMTLVKPTTAPTERSIPAVMTTNVSPRARIAIIAPCRSRLAMLLGVQKLFVLNDSTTHMSARRATRVKPISVPICALLFVAASCTSSDNSILPSTLILPFSAMLYLVCGGSASNAERFR